MTTYGSTAAHNGSNAGASEPEPELKVERPADPNEGCVMCPGCHFTMTWGTNAYNTYTCDLCDVSKSGERWVCEKCSNDQCSPCNPYANTPPKLIVRRRFKDCKYKQSFLDQLGAGMAWINQAPECFLKDCLR